MPHAAQLGVIAFGLALVLLAIAQAISIASQNARADAAMLKELQAAIKQLAKVSAGRQSNSLHRKVASVCHNPRPLRRMGSKKKINTRRVILQQSKGSQH